MGSLVLVFVACMVLKMCEEQAECQRLFGLKDAFQVSLVVILLSIGLLAATLGLLVYNFFKMTIGLRLEAPTPVPRRLSRSLSSIMAYSTRVEPAQTSKVLAPEESEAGGN